MSQHVYLDHAATTPMRAPARAAVAAGMADWANPSSPHAAGRAARATLERARGAIGAAYGWPGEVLLTSGTSEALAIALNRSVATRVLIGASEHDAVIRAAPGATILPVAPNGLLDLDALDRALGEGNGRAIMAVQWANSETGVLQPLEAIAARVHAAGALLLVDAAQMPPPADQTLAMADFVALSSHKRGGPPGIGALLVRDLATVQPSGGQERGYRPGTENVPGAVGYAAALAERPDLARWARLRGRLDDTIRRSGGVVVGEDAPRHPAIGSYRMPGVAATVQLIRFDLGGIAVSAGSACSSGSMKPSHVLSAMGWQEPALREVVRVSFGHDTDEAAVDAFVAAWRAIARDVRRAAA